MRGARVVATLALMAGAAGAQSPADSARGDSVLADPARRATVPPAPPRVAAPDPWLGGDKARHFLVAGMVQGSAFGVATAAAVRREPAMVAASLVTAAVSLGKEWVDRRRGRPFSVRDLAWDAAGAALWGALLARSGR